MTPQELIEQALWLAPVAAFLLTVIVLPLYIRYLNERQIQQYLREEGPKSHATKANTPTGGGVAFVAAFIAVVLAALSAGALPPGGTYVWAVIAVALGCFVIGFVDDLAKVMAKSNAGISGRVRLSCEFLLGAGLGYFILSSGLPAPTLAAAGEAGGISAPVLQLLWGNWPLMIGFSAFLVAATSNALNLHDGMDGLASGTSIMVFATIAFMCVSSNQPDLALIAATACGALIGFLCFNRHRARIFMGDTGSLFIGGLMAALVIASGTVVYFVPLSIIYILEALSVMSQVSYFKLTKEYIPDKPMSKPALAVHKLTHRLPGEGKRLFRITPLHHHFEAVYGERGVEEWLVVAGFWAVQAFVCLCVLAAFLHYR